MFVTSRLFILVARQAEVGPLTVKDSCPGVPLLGSLRVSYQADIKSRGSGVTYNWIQILALLLIIGAILGKLLDLWEAQLSLF